MNELKPGYFLSEEKHYIYQGRSSSGQLIFKDLTNGQPVLLHPDYVKNRLLCANTYELEIRLTRSEITEKFISLSTVPCTITWIDDNEKIKGRDHLKQVADSLSIFELRLDKAKKNKKSVKKEALLIFEELLEGKSLKSVGKTKTVIGWKSEFISNNGYYGFIEVKQNNTINYIQINSNKITSMIVHGIKYLIT